MTLHVRRKPTALAELLSGHKSNEQHTIFVLLVFTITLTPPGAL